MNESNKIDDPLTLESAVCGVVSHARNIYTDDIKSLVMIFEKAASDMQQLLDCELEAASQPDPGVS